MTNTLGQVGTLAVDLAGGTDRQWVVMQARQNGSSLRIQGPGHESDFPVPDALATWWKGLEHSRPSLAGTSAVYAPLEITVEDSDEGKVCIQVPGPKLNRDFGAMFKVKHPSLCEWVRARLAKMEGKAIGVIPNPGELDLEGPGDEDDEDDDC
jgi:hypothetical protein